MDEINSQANLSLREIAFRTKEFLKAKGIHAPDTSNMYAVKVDNRTVFYYSSEDRRKNHLQKLNKYFDHIVLLEPK